VRVALEEKGVLPDILRLVKTLVHIAKLKGHDAVHVPHPIIVVDTILRVARASAMDISERNGSYVTSMWCKAASAVASSTAATAATGSPT
jgi:hypothetical protein